MTLSKLDQDALAAGIAVEFINAKGEPENISDEIKRALLAVMDTPAGKVPPLQVFTPRTKRQLTPQGKGEFSWLLQSE